MAASLPVGRLFPATVTRVSDGVAYVHANDYAPGREFEASASLVIAGWTAAAGDRVLIGVLAGLVDQIVLLGPLTGA